MKSGISIVLVLWAAIIFGGCGQKSESANSTSGKTSNQPSVTFNSTDEVKAFVRENLAKPIPDDYEIPKYISSGLPLEQVYDTLEVRYPDFYGKQGDAYLQAIMNSPDRYLQMSLESKSIRRYYDPNSRY